MARWMDGEMQRGSCVRGKRRGDGVSDGARKRLNGLAGDQPMRHGRQRRQQHAPSKAASLRVEKRDDGKGIVVSGSACVVRTPAWEGPDGSGYRGKAARDQRQQQQHIAYMRCVALAIWRLPWIVTMSRCSGWTKTARRGCGRMDVHLSIAANRCQPGGGVRVRADPAGGAPHGGPGRLRQGSQG